ncbi:hypothetical protein BGZ91_001937 [Linnemannia elongata]|nr:hypothetical protein BGZ91_001937 [Linnemannia elongata]
MSSLKFKPGLTIQGMILTICLSKLAMSSMLLSISLQRGPSGRVVQVVAHYHSDSGQNIVLWDDILDLFPAATSVLNGNVAVSRARDASFRKYQPGKVLEVVMAGDLTTHHPGSSLSSTGTIVAPQTLTHKNIAQWAISMAENTAMEEHYAPSVYSQFTDITTRPFKPLYQPSFADDDDLGMDNNSLKEERLAVSGGENAALPDDNAANDDDADGDDSDGWWPETPKPVKVNVGEETWYYFDKELERWVKRKSCPKTFNVTEPIPPPPMSHSATPVSISSPAIKGLPPLNRSPPPGPKPAFAGLPARRGAVSGMPELG